MKAVLISIQPKWCELIASGKKTVEVRKTKPKIDVPFKCYIYCTNSSGALHSAYDGLHYHKSYIGKNDSSCISGKVIGEFVCKEFTYIEAGYDTNENKHLYNTAFIEHRMCIPDNELFDYLYKSRENSGGWGWHISDLVIYDKPKELSEFKQCHKCEYYANCYEHEYSCDGVYNLIRPPQSWCYVEELS